MAIIRRALLIGSNDLSAAKGQRRLRGVDRDIANMRSFLLSDAGGAWEQNEIFVGKTPTTSDINGFLAQCKSDGVHFLFVYYSGHGYTNADGEPCIMMNSPGVDILVKKLATQCPRQVTIIDACRDRIGQSIGMDKVAGVLGALPNPTPPRHLYRRAFDNAVAGASGQYLVQSCADNESSADTGTGGLYTNMLFETVDGFSSNNSLTAFTIWRVAQQTKSLLAQYDDEQHPTATWFGDQRSRNFPFVIA